MIPALYSLILLLFTVTFLHPSAVVDIEGVKVSLTGFVAVVNFADTRQTVNIRQGHTMFYPKRIECVGGCDVNDNPYGGMSGIQSRLIVTALKEESPTIYEKAVFEIDALGETETRQISFIRPRIAFVDWRREELQFICGRYYQLYYVPEALPLTISYNIGEPMVGLKFVPQARMIYYPIPAIDIMVGLATDVPEAASLGVFGRTADYARWAVIPTAIGQVRFAHNEWRSAVSCDISRMKPRLASEQVCVSEYLTACSFSWYTVYKNEWLRLMGRVSVVQNGFHYGFIGGYGVTSIAPNGEREYAPMQEHSFIADVDVALTDRWSVGMFGGYGRNRGADKDFVRDPADANRYLIFRVDEDLDYVGRWSTRLVYQKGAIKAAAEIEYTRAGYGHVKSNGAVQRKYSVGNWRVVGALFYFF